MKAGDLVELRPPAAILATLDDRGALDGLPFMPEMLQYFGKTLSVTARVERACDTIGYTGVRRLPDTVILDDLRCDGTGHAGCGAGCRLYWKEAWLQPPSAGAQSRDFTDHTAFEQLKRLAEAHVRPVDAPDESRFRCQATELVRASEPVGAYSRRSLLNEVASGNVGLLKFVRVATRGLLSELGARLGIVTFQPFRRAELRGQRSTPRPVSSELRPGQLVRIRSKDEIRRTLAENGKNRGLWFDREMVPYCGQTARVGARVERFIDEVTGELVELKSDCYILEGVVCQGTRSDRRWFCPRAIYPWWREAWLQPVEPRGDRV